MSSLTVDGTLVQEVNNETLKVRVSSPDFSELKPGISIALKMVDRGDRCLGTVLALHEDQQITVLMDWDSLIEQEARVENVDQVLGGLPDRVRPIQGMDAGW